MVLHCLLLDLSDYEWEVARAVPLQSLRAEDEEEKEEEGKEDEALGPEEEAGSRRRREGQEPSFAERNQDGKPKACLASFLLARSVSASQPSSRSVDGCLQTEKRLFLFRGRKCAGIVFLKKLRSSRSPPQSRRPCNADGASNSPSSLTASSKTSFRSSCPASTSSRGKFSARTASATKGQELGKGWTSSRGVTSLNSKSSEWTFAPLATTSRCEVCAFAQIFVFSSAGGGAGEAERLRRSRDRVSAQVFRGLCWGQRAT